MPSTTLRRILVAYVRERRTPLVSAMARAIRQRVDVDDDVHAEVACAWIAAKFEEVDPPFADELWRMAGARPCFSLPLLARAERDVLARLDWRLPYRTPTNATLEQLGDDDAFEADCVHLTLWADVDAACEPQEWAAAIRDARDGVRVAVPLQLAAAHKRLPHAFAKVRARLLPPRLRWEGKGTKRQREEETDGGTLVA